MVPKLEKISRNLGGRGIFGTDSLSRLASSGRVRILAPGLLLLIALVGRAEVGRPVAQVTPFVENTVVRAGTSVPLSLQVTLPEGLHVQSNAPRDPALIPTVLTIEMPAGVGLEEIIYPAVSDLRQAGVTQPLAVFEQSFTIGVRIRLAASVPPGRLELRGRLRYQACNAQVCFQPANADVSWLVAVVASGEPAVPPPATASAPVAPAPSVSRNLVRDVRVAAAGGDFARGDVLVEAHRAVRGVTPELLLAISWQGRMALTARRLDLAEGYARRTYELALLELKRRAVDDEADLPTALGAAIEVRARVAAEHGARTEALAFLNGELKTYGETSLHKRIQKEINLITLEGTRAPPLELAEYLGEKPPVLAELKGRVVLLFFWAHWCSDCKEQGPDLERLLNRFGAQGLAIVAPTQRFGYVAGDVPATVEQETRYIEQVRQRSYGWMTTAPAPLSEVNHRRYGVSTTPTLVVIDRAGIIRLYHPGTMREAELAPLVQRLLIEGERLGLAETTLP